MFLEKLALFNFRNFEREEARFTALATVILGGNGQGKTNLIEAVYFLSALRSFRTAKINYLKKIGENEASVSGTIRSVGNVREELEVYWFGEKRGQKYLGKDTSPSEYISKLTAISFTPEDLQIISGLPERRRKLLDKTVFSIYPAYIDVLKNYQRLLRQRNQTLKHSYNERPNIALLESWDEELSKYAAEIFIKRTEIIKLLSQKVKEHYENISGGEGEVLISYESQAIVNSVCANDMNKVRETYYNLWQRSIEKDIRRGGTSKGPHTEEIVFHLKGKRARETASQGQKRSLVVSLKIGEIELIQERRGNSPILLLDDVMSELDKNRREKLFEYLSKHKGQVIATTTDLVGLNISELNESEIFRIEEGKLIKSSS